MASPRGPHGAAGEARARALPLTGPADAARRLEAIGAGRPSQRFLAAASLGFLEWPGRRPAPAAEALDRAGGLVTAPDRTLLAGDVPALAEAAAAQAPDLARWLRAQAVPPSGPPPLRCGPFLLHFGLKTYIVAIVNRTPDSFSDGRGSVPPVEEAVAAAWAGYAAGADIVDVGAESSEERDGGTLAPQREAERLLPVLHALRDLPALVSVDSRRGSVARAALAVRPVICNDVEALADPELATAAAEAGAPVVLMHSGPIPPGQDALPTIAGRLEARLRQACALGIPARQVILDPGFGFGTTLDEDLLVTRRLGELRALGRPLLHAPSRKRTIGRVLSFPDTIPERLPGTAAAVAIGIAAGADLIRVHDVLEMARVARMTDALVRGPAWRDLTAP